MQQETARGLAGLATQKATTGAAATTRRPRGINWSYALTSWLGLVPFLLFCLLFEILPAIIIVQGSFTDDRTGAFTLNNYQHMLGQTNNLHAFQTSISISLVTALLGTIV